MLNIEPLSTSSSSCATLSNVALEPVFASLNLVGGVLVVVIGVDVKVDDMVTKVGHVGLTLTGAA